MPYIKQEDREKFEDILNNLHLAEINNPGDLNFLITCLVQTYIVNKGICYQSFNDAIGALEGAKLELYRKSIASYEDLKIKENGNVNLGLNHDN